MRNAQARSGAQDGKRDMTGRSAGDLAAGSAGDDAAHLAGAPTPAAQNTIDQVRELLFGQEKRRTDQSLTELRAELAQQVDALRAEMRDHVESLTARLIDLDKTSEQRRLESITDIGQAISKLGASIQNMGADTSRR